MNNNINIINNNNNINDAIVKLERAILKDKICL